MFLLPSAWRSTFGTGGIAGRSVAAAAVVSECYNTGNIKSAAEATGGVVGYMNADGSTLTSSYSTGNITIKKIKREKALTRHGQAVLQVSQEAKA